MQNQHFEALNFEFYVFLHLFNAKIYQINKFRAFNMAKKAVLEHLHAPKFISCKI